MLTQPPETQPEPGHEFFEEIPLIPNVPTESDQIEGDNKSRREFLECARNFGVGLLASRVVPHNDGFDIPRGRTQSPSPRLMSRRGFLGMTPTLEEPILSALHSETVVIGDKIESHEQILNVFDALPTADRFQEPLQRNSERRAIHPRYANHPVAQDFNPADESTEVRISPNFRTRQVATTELYMAQLLLESNGLQTTEQRITGLLNEIYGHEPKFIIEVYTPTGERVSKNFNDLSNEEKGCVMAYARGLEFFRDTMNILRSAGNASGTSQKLFIDSQVEEFKVIIDTSKQYIPSAATGVGYDPVRGDVSKVGQYVTSIEDVEAELPHATFLLGRRSLRTNAQMAVEGSPDGFRSHPHIEAMSNLTHSVFKEIVEKGETQYPALSINGGGRSFLYVIGDGLALREPPSLDEYQMTVEAWGFEIAKAIYETIDIFKRLPECLNGSKPVGMLDYAYELLKKKYAGVVGLLRVMNTITSTDLLIDNNQVDAYINACGSDVQADLRKVYEKLKELNATSIISSAAYANLKDNGGVLSEVRRDDILEASYNGQYMIAVVNGIAVQINNDSGNEARFEFKQSQIVDNETSGSNTKVMVEVRRYDGTVGYVDATSLVSMFHGVDDKNNFNGLTTILIPRMFVLEGKGATATGNVIMIAEMTKPSGIGDEIKESQGHSMHFEL